MKVKYEFANGEVTEIEVEESLGEILLDLDRQEYNINHKETRWHCSLNALDLDDALLPDETDVFEDVIRAVEYQRLYAAIQKLETRQQYLIREIFLKGRSQTEIAAEEDVSRSAISHAVDRAIKKLKKFLS